MADLLAPVLQVEGYLLMGAALLMLVSHCTIWQIRWQMAVLGHEVSDVLPVICFVAIGFRSRSSIYIQ